MICICLFSDWSILYVIVITFLIVVTLAGTMWAVICFCRRYRLIDLLIYPDSIHLAEQWSNIWDNVSDTRPNVGRKLGRGLVSTGYSHTRWLFSSSLY